MRVLHVSLAYPPFAWGGPIDQLHSLLRAMRRGGVDARVVTTDSGANAPADAPTNRWTEYEGIPVYYSRCWTRRFFIAPAAWRAIRIETAMSDVVHMSQFWSWMTVAAARSARKSGIPFAVSPRGGMDPRARAIHAGRKTVFGAMGGYAALRSAAGFHATSERERDEIAEFMRGVSTVVIPNGVRVPDEAARSRWGAPDASMRDVLFLGRIHPIKNLPTLLLSWSDLTSAGRAARLIIAGPDERGHQRELERLAGELGISGSVEFRGLVSGEEKHRLLATAWSLVLPSKTENFGNVVAEALACGTPVIASAGTPWASLRERRCGWWVPADRDSLRCAIVEALDLAPSERDAMGARGRAWMTAEFGFDAIAKRLCDWYQVLVGRTGDRERTGRR